MARRIKITAIHNQEPNVGLYVLALIALARQIQEEERREQQAQTARQTVDTESADD